jgi:hypothetical protein
LKTKAKLLITGIILLLVSCIVLVGCGVSKGDYNAVVAERDAANANVAKGQADLQAAQAQIASLQGNITALQGNIIEVGEMALQGNTTALRAEIATLKLPDVLKILSVVPAIQAWSGNATNTTLLGALTTAVNKSGDAGLIQKWQAFLAASAAGNVRYELLQFYGYMLGQASEVAPSFPASVQPLMEVGASVDALMQGLNQAALGKTAVAINASGNQELMNRWNQIMGTFSTSLPQAMKMMVDMQVWMLGQIAAAAPNS